MLCTGWVPPSFSHTRSNLSLDLSLQVQARKAHLFSSTTLLSHSPQLLLRSSPAARPRNPPPQLALRVIPVSQAPPSGHKLMLRPTASPAVSSVEPSSTTPLLSTSGPWTIYRLVGPVDSSAFDQHRATQYSSGRETFMLSNFSPWDAQSVNFLLWGVHQQQHNSLIYKIFFVYTEINLM